MFADRINQIKAKGSVEGKRLFWIFAYLWILLGLFSIQKSIVLNEPNLIYHQGFAFINAWLLAKVMLTAEMFYVADNLKQKPLIYPIMFKSAIFSAILMSFYILEETLIGMWHGKTAAASIPDIGGGSLKGILVVGLMMFVVLIPLTYFSCEKTGICRRHPDLHLVKRWPRHSQAFLGACRFSHSGTTRLLVSYGRGLFD